MSADPVGGGLPKRDFLIIPLIAFVTALVMLGASELLASSFFYEAQRGNCSVHDDLHGHRNVPNCTYYNKAAEGPLVEYDFNGCGYRSREPCGPKPAGTVRVALLGASTAEGFKVAYDEAFAPRAGKALSALCRRPVEFQNLGVPGYRVIDQYFRLGEALDLKPDLVMLVLTPYELVDITDPAQLANRDHPEHILAAARQPQRDVNQAGLVARVSEALSQSKAALAAQYYLFQDSRQYVNLFLMYGDKADYLRQPFSPAWTKRLADLDLMAGEMAERIHREGLPFVILFTPQRIQASLANPALRPPGVDPTAIGNAIAAIAARHGIAFIDTYEAFRRTPDSDKLFYPVDGHMTPAGHALVAQALVQGLLSSALPAFAGCANVAQSAQ